jgi:mucin-19
MTRKLPTEVLCYGYSIRVFILSCFQFFVLTGSLTAQQNPGCATPDNVAPVITPLSANLSIPLNANGTKTITLADIATITDNCNPSPVYTLSATQFNCTQKGLQTITVQATDGNFGTALNPSAAGFNYPFALDFDPQGNLYVLENNRLRKIAVDGTTSTIAGGSDGYADGQGLAARFNQAKGIAIDAQGNIFIGDWGNHAIRKVTPSGLVTTFAGNGVAGYADGTGTNALFNGPAGLCFDGAGNLWVADAENHRIRKISPSGVVTTVAGTGTGSSTDGSLTTASFNYPLDIDFDLNGNAYIVDLRSNKLRLLTSSAVTTVAGSGFYGFADGAASTAMFANLSCVAVGNDGNIYLADRSNKRIRKLTTAGQVQTLATSAGEITGLAKSSSGSYYFIDYQNHYVKRVTTNGTVSIVAGTGFQSSANGNVGQQPTGNESSLQITVNIVDNSAPVITPVSNNIILPLNSNGTRMLTPADIAVVTDNCNTNPLVAISPTTFNCSNVGQQIVTVTATDGTFGTPRTPANAAFLNPYDLEFDNNGNLIIADYQNNKIKKLTPAGIVSTLAGNGVRASVNGTGTNASFDSPISIAVDAAGNTYVTDYFNHGIRKVTPAGVVTTYTGGSSGLVNGHISTARFSYPNYIAFDPSGNLFVVDHGNNLIRKITPAGMVSTFAGDGSCGAEGYCTITALATDASGNVYIGKDNKIRKITPAGVATWIAGTGTYGSADGPVMSATLANPWNIVVDASGTIWFTDQTLNKIRRITTTGMVETLPITANNVNPTFAKGNTISPSGSLYFTAGNAIVERKQDGTQTLIAGAFNNYGDMDGDVGGGQSGNQTSLQITVTITGNSTPVFTTTQNNVSATAGSSCSVILANYTGNAAATSSCGGAVTITQSPAAGSSISVGVTTVTLTATDASGNSSTQSFTVTVNDNAAPVITPVSNNIILPLSSNGTATLSAADVATIADCTSPAVRVSPSAFNCSSIGAQTVTVEATDGIFGTPNPDAALFNEPVDVTTDPAGNIYVGDRVNNRIRKISPAGFVTTFITGGSALRIESIACDANGNIYVTDGVNKKVHKITPAGVASVYAGNGVAAVVDGPAASASFESPYSITVDAGGNVYVSDGNSIRQISSGGIVSSIAGTQTAGFADGTGTSARFRGPSGLACDASGNIYVADGANYRVRKVTPAGVVTTIAGNSNNGFADGPFSTARFGFLHGIVLDNNGNIYVADGDSRRIRKLAGGIVSTIAGNGNTSSVDGNISTASFDLITGITITGGNFVVCEIYAHKIRRADINGNVTTIAGNGTAGSTNGNVGGITGNYNSLQIPVTVVDITAPLITPLSNNIVLNLDASGNKTITAADIVTISDCNASPLVRVSPSSFNCSSTGVQTITVETTDGTFGTGPNPAAVSFISPQAVVADAAGNFYVAANNQIRKISASGVVTTLAGSGIEGSTDGVGLAASFNGLRGLAIDAAGNLYTAEVWSRKVRKVTPDGVVTTVAGSGAVGSNDGPASSASFIWVYSVVLDQQGNIFVADAGSNKIRKISTSGIVSTYAGTGQVGSQDGPAGSATFNYITSLAIDNTGNLFVGEQFKIRKISPDGIVSTFAGGLVSGNVPGIGTNARMARPMGLVFDAAGNLYATQEGDGRIIKITPDAFVSTFAGSYGETTINGTGTVATFRSPEGICIDVSGNLYVADWFLRNIRKITPDAVVTTFAGSGESGSQNGDISGSGTGNYTFLQIPVTVRDITPPVIVCPADINSVVTSTHPNQTGSATATDNCSTGSALTITYTDGSDPEQGCFIIRTWKATDASGNSSSCVQRIATPGLSVSLGPDMFILYGALGYTGCRTITPVITGGIAPYTYSWTSNDPSYASSNASSLAVCHTSEVSYTYTLTITAANGCTGTASVQLTFINISCSNNGNTQKVTICHRPEGNPQNCKTICVPVSAVQVLINSGSYYGQCLTGCAIPVQARTQATIANNNDEIQNLFDVKVLGNPSSSYFILRVTGNRNEKIRARVLDALGQLIEVKENIQPDQLVQLGHKYTNGMYLVEITQGTNSKTVKLIKQ